MRIRNAFPVFGLLTTLALAGCSTSSDSASVDDKGAGPTVQTAQIFDDAYGVTKDAGYSLPAIPISRVKPQFRRQVVNYETTERPGTIIVNTRERFLYYILANGKAMRYGIGVGKQGFAWAGTAYVAWKQEWPTWHPPKEMAVRRPDVAKYVEDGMGPGLSNPLGARAMYLGSTLYRIHGTNAPWTIGSAVSSGCIRLRNEDVVDLYERVKVGTRVIVI